MKNKMKSQTVKPEIDGEVGTEDLTLPFQVSTVVEAIGTVGDPGYLELQPECEIRRFPSQLCGLGQFLEPPRTPVFCHKAGS